MFPTADGNHLTDDIGTGSLKPTRGVRAKGISKGTGRWNTGGADPINRGDARESKA